MSFALIATMLDTIQVFFCQRILSTHNTHDTLNTLNVLYTLFGETENLKT